MTPPILLLYFRFGTIYVSKLDSFGLTTNRFGLMI